MASTMLPISIKDLVRYTPPVFEGRDDAPVFLLKVPTLRERIALDAAIAAEGVRYPSDTELAQALRDAVAEHVIEQQWPELLAIVEEFEAAIEEGNAAAEDVTAGIDQIKQTLRAHHRPLAEIEAERGRFLSTAMLVRTEMLLAGVEGKNATPISRRAGRLTEECVAAIEDRYGAGTVMAIGARTVALTMPTPDDTKNSASPPPLPPGPATSKAAKKPPTAPNGKSSASDIPATLGSA